MSVWMGTFSHLPERVPVRTRWLSASAAAILVCTWLAAALPAEAAWEAPVEIAESSQRVDGGGAAAALGIYEGNTTVAYRATEKSIAVRHRDKGEGAYSSAQTLEESVSNTLESPAVAAGAGGKSLTAWALVAGKTEEDRVRCATRVSGASTFSTCAAPLLGSDNGSWGTGWVRAAGNGAGTAAVAFEGPGTAGFSQAFGSYGPVSGGLTTQALSGNDGVGGSGRNNYPQVAVNAAGDAVEVWTGWPTFSAHAVGIGYRDHAGSEWTVLGGGGAQIYCCSNMIGNYRVAIDGAGNGYVVVGGGETEDKGIVFDYAPRAHALGGGGGWGEQHLDLGEAGEPQKPENPRVAVDSAGDATAVWVAEDFATHRNALFAAYRPAGAATTFGSPIEVVVAPESRQVEASELAVSPAGNVVVAWITCAESACNNREVQARTRATSGGAFGPVETIVNSETSKRGLTLAGDPQGDVLLGWSEGGSNKLFASAYVPPSTPPAGAGAAGSGGSSSGGSGSGGGAGGSTPSASPELTLLGTPSAGSSGATFTVACVAPVGQTCDGAAELTTTEQLVGGKAIALSSRKRKHPRAASVSVGKTVFVVGAGGRKTVYVALNATGRRLLARFHRLPATLKVTLKSAGKSSLVSKRALVIRPPAKKHPRKR
jgi:hypothetical protein